MFPSGNNNNSGGNATSNREIAMPFNVDSKTIDALDIQLMNRRNEGRGFAQSCLFLFIYWDPTLPSPYDQLETRLKNDCGQQS